WRLSQPPCDGSPAASQIIHGTKVSCYGSCQRRYPTGS
ncbi:MAG: hypothetical protein AVDCRST_MAG19-1495, partial [uncultured Thermomicrobiales bacterium]